MIESIPVVRVAMACAVACIALACASQRPEVEPDLLPMCNPVRELLHNGGFESRDLSGFSQSSGNGTVVVGAAPLAGCAQLEPRSGTAAFAVSGAREVVLRQALPLDQAGLTPGALIAGSMFVAGACAADARATSRLTLRFLRGGVGGELLQEQGGEALATAPGAFRQQITPTAKVPHGADTLELVLSAEASPGASAVTLLADDLSLAACSPLGEPLAAWKLGHAVADTQPEDARRGPAPVPVPEKITDGNTAISCTLDCGGDPSCAAATVYVSACAQDRRNECHAITPFDAPQSGGNTWFVALDAMGGAQLIAGSTCAAGQESKESLPLDLVFVIDTTGSMAQAIAGVVESIDALVDGLAKKGVDSRIGGIAFGDGAPLQRCVAPQAPYATFTEVFGPGTEGDPKSFNYWLAHLSAGHCGDEGGDGPENALDALEYTLGNLARDKKAAPFEWRAGALRVVVLITDVVQHQRKDGSGIAHFDLEDVVRDVTGVAVVHTVSPDFGCGSSGAGRCSPRNLGSHADVAQLSLATGGAFTPLPRSGRVDLTALPLAGVITATEKCRAALPGNASQLRCVYRDDVGNQGEVVIDVARRNQAR